ncbi:glutaredoxin domain protein [Moniliophthora roreri MCA 2997]|uniref:Glutaredoxin domain protein n=2 Tax=Moniliophthora roreri TaxID=221103 RepID=V2XJD3_MONRO|nr:glutaredoxin domain protein [Moniliophthora roreri MCA 2997]
MGLATTTIRRRRFIALMLTAVVFFLLFLRGAEWELPDVLKDAGVPLSKGNFAHYVKRPTWMTKPKVDEIYGLIHLVTNEDEEHQHVLSSAPDLDPTEPVDMNLYAPGEEKDVDWEKEVSMLNEKYPVVVFSKSFCPFSKRAKALLETYGLRPPPKVIEVDLRDDSTQIKAILTRLTKQSTFPNIFIQGKSVGGSDDLHKLHSEKSLRRILEKAGVQVIAEDV